MNYLYLIKKLFNYNLYIKYRNHIKVDKDQKEIYFLFKSLDNLMNTYQRDIQYEEFSLWVQVNYGNDYNVLLDLIKTTDISEDIIEDTLTKIKERSLSYELATLALEVSEGKKDVSLIKDFITQFDEVKKEDKDIFVSDNLKDIYERQIQSPGLRWRLDSLNRSLGSLRRSNFGFIFARPETGKTTFLASECTHFATQTTSPILWINNEQGGENVMLRLYQAALGLTINDLGKDEEGNYKKYLDITKHNIKLFDSATIHKYTIEHLLKEYKPAIMVIDQIDKIKGFNDDREDLRLGAIYIWARELAKEYCPIIGVCQADGSGEGKKYLTMDNVANAKTAKQAEADFIIGIGKSNDPGFEMIRHFNICKNKLVGDSDTDPKMRHAKIDVLIQQDIARYKDI